MRLRKQLFFTLLVCSALLVAVLFAFNAWSFSRGFSNYLAEGRLNPLIQELAQRYDEHGSWDWVYEGGMVPVRGSGRSEMPLAWLRAIEQRVESDTRARSAAGAADSGNADDQSNNQNNGRHQQRRERESLRLASRIAANLVLANSQKERLVGNLVVNAVEWLPIKVDATVAGFLGYRKNPQMDGLLNKAFLHQQTRSFAIAAAALALISAILSLPLSSRLVRPIAIINGAVGKIRDGQYETRIDSRRRDELGELSTSINSMAKSLQSNQQARQRWVAEISHELRTPLAVLQGELEAVEDNIRPMNQETVSGLMEQTTRLSRLVEDLHVLSMSDLGALDYRFTPLNMALVVSDVLTEFTTQLAQAGIAVDSLLPQDLPVIDIDRQRFGQLLNNLMQNTLGYTNQGGSLRVSLDVVSAEPDFIQDVSGSSPHRLIRLIWSDSAPGVSDDQLAQLFEPLFRTETSRSRRTGGSGLGLSIAQKIVEAHGGKIDASHASEGGLKLTMHFPPASNLIPGKN